MPPTLRLLSLNKAAEDFAAKDGVSLNQYVAGAHTEKIGARGAAEFFEERGKNGSADRAIALREGWPQGVEQAGCHFQLFSYYAFAQKRGKLPSNAGIARDAKFFRLAEHTRVDRIYWRRNSNCEVCRSSSWRG